MKRGSTLNRLLDFYLGIPALHFLALFKRPAAFPDHVNRIGILFNPALGDTLLGSVVTGELRKLFPGARLIVFAARPNLSAARLLANVDTVEFVRITDPIRTIRTLRRCGLDLMLDLTAWQRITAIYSLCSGARYVVGFRRDHQYRHCAYHLTVHHRNDCHELDNLRRFCSTLGSTGSPMPQLTVGASRGITEHLRSRRTVVFHPWASGSRGNLREWPSQSWVELACRMNTCDRTILLTGSPQDEARCEILYQDLLSHGVRAKILIGRDGIEEIARALLRAELLVSVNTGIMHLGAILGVPTVALNGPTSVRRWGAVGARVANVEPSSGRGGFLDLGFEYRGRTVNIMRDISVAQVLCAIERLLRVCPWPDSEDLPYVPTPATTLSVARPDHTSALAQSGVRGTPAHML